MAGLLICKFQLNYEVCISCFIYLLTCCLALEADIPGSVAFATDVTDLPYCQQPDQFVTFHDVSSYGSGIQHKYKDFRDACRIAIQLNRTLIDYTAKFSRQHVKNRQGKHSRPIEFVLGWKFGDLFNLTNLVYDIKEDEDSPEIRCRFRHSQISSTELGGSLLTIEYARQNIHCKNCNYRITDVNFWELSSFKRNKPIIIEKVANEWQFSDFIRSSAQQVREYCLSNARTNLKSLNRTSVITNFTVIHLRGTDRPAALRTLSPEQIISRIESLGIDKSSHVVYLMTDLEPKSRHLLALKSHFDKFYFFSSIGVPLFDKEPFSSTGEYLVYAAELELQKISDGFLNTYRRGDFDMQKNYLGSLY